MAGGEYGVRGFVAAYKQSTGEQVWKTYTIPGEGEPGNETWAGDSWVGRSGVNVWGFLTVDAKRGLIYVATGDSYTEIKHPTSDAVVAMDLKTGKIAWYFQFVHHGIWDYDLPAAPNLMDLTVDGRKIKAAVQVTKQGFLFAFDRISGKPIWPITEKKVPKGDVPGEWYSPTQPFPSKIGRAHV